MNVPELPLWLWSLLCIAGLAGGMALHLGFHPLRQDFSDALDLLKNQPRLLLLAGALQYARLSAGSDGFYPLTQRVVEEWTNWRALAPALLEESATQWAMLLHQALPPWPAVMLLLPLLLAGAVWNLHRQPYRAGLRHRPRGVAWLLLVSLPALSMLFSLAEVGLSLADLPEWVETLLLGGRLFCLALLTTILQLGVLRLACLWQMPNPQTSSAKPLHIAAWWEVLGRWRLLLPLALFNATWIALQSWSNLSPSPLVAWLLVEMLVFFAPLPVAAALAAPGSSFLKTGAHALRLLARAVLQLAGLGLTSVIIIALAHYAGGLLGALAASWRLPEAAFQVPVAFALAFVHIWLFLTAAFLLLRHGRRTTDTASDSLPHRPTP